VVPTGEALELARKRDLDLVEIAPNVRPPVCRIMDYGKYKYEQGKKIKKGHQTKVKEIKFHANVGEHDYMTKLRHASDFLEQGHRVKCSLYFRGRENDHREFGFELMKRIIKDCNEIGIPEQEPRMMGKNLIMLITPSKKIEKKSPKSNSATPSKAPAEEAAG
jgi:translation initiation factor IF-3